MKKRSGDLRGPLGPTGAARSPYSVPLSSGIPAVHAAVARAVSRALRYSEEIMIEGYVGDFARKVVIDAMNGVYNAEQLIVLRGPPSEAVVAVQPVSVAPAAPILVLPPRVRRSPARKARREAERAQRAFLVPSEPQCGDASLIAKLDVEPSIELGAIIAPEVEPPRDVYDARLQLCDVAGGDIDMDDLFQDNTVQSQSDIVPRDGKFFFGGDFAAFDASFVKARTRTPSARLDGTPMVRIATLPTAGLGALGRYDPVRDMVTPYTVRYLSDQEVRTLCQNLTGGDGRMADYFAILVNYTLSVVRLLPLDVSTLGFDHRARGYPDFGWGSLPDALLQAVRYLHSTFEIIYSGDRWNLVLRAVHGLRRECRMLEHYYGRTASLLPAVFQLTIDSELQAVRIRINRQTSGRFKSFEFVPISPFDMSDPLVVFAIWGADRQSACLRAIRQLADIYGIRRLCCHQYGVYFREYEDRLRGNDTFVRREKKNKRQKRENKAREW